MSVPSSDLPAAAASTTSSGFADGLGRRSLAFDREEGTMLERLAVRPELAAFERVLRERLERAAGIEDQRIARPRGLERAGDGGLVVVSEFVPGTRLSDLLDACAQAGIAPGVDAALGFLLDVLPALCGLHAGAGFAHGTIAPSRTVLTPAGEVVLLDAIYGGAVSYLRYGRQRLWTDFGIATPSTGGTPRLDVQTDIAQVALSAMLLVLGRPLADDEYRKGLQSVIGEVVDVAQIRGTPEFAEGLLEILERTLQVNEASPFATADDALIEIRGLAQEIGLQVCRQALVDLIQQAERLTDPGVEDDDPAIPGIDPAITSIDPTIDRIAPELAGIVPEIDGLGPEIDGIVPEIVAVYPEDDIDLSQGRAFESDADPIVDAEIDLDTLAEAPQEEPVLLAWPTRSGPTTPALEAALEAVGVQGDLVELPSPEPAVIEPEPRAAAGAAEIEGTPPVTTPIESRPPAPIEATSPAAAEAAKIETTPPAPIPIESRRPATIEPKSPAAAGSVKVDAPPPATVPIEQAPPAAIEPQPRAADDALKIETTSPATLPIEPPPPPPAPSVRSKRAKRARSSRARKDRLRSAAAAAATPIVEKPIAEEKKAPAEPLPPPEPEKPAKTTDWLVPPDAAAAFEPPVPEPVPGPAPVVGAPLPVSAPSVPSFPPPMQPPFSGPAVAAPPPAPAVPQYSPVPLQPAGAPSIDALARTQEPVIYPPITPGYAPPPLWTPPPPATPASVASAPVPPKPIALAEQTPQRPKPLKLKEPTRRPQPGSLAPRDIYSQPPPSTPRDSAGEFPWKVAIGALVLVAAVIAGGRAMLWTERKADERSAQEPAAATPAATKLPAVAGATGRIEIETQPAGARVLLNGKPAGEAPLTIDAVPAGRYTVTLVSSAGTVKRTVRVQAGRTARLDVPIFSGWVGIFAPFVVEVSENGTVIGTTEDPRLMLSPGPHVLTLTNKALGYRSVQTVQIEPGQTRSLRLDPRGTVNFNASPWAEVWIDGKKIGDTPIANQSMPLGIHEIVFKHPDFGERRVPVTVRGDAPTAVSVDMTAR